MMSSPARKIVVGVGLVAVFAIGVSMIIVPAKQGTQNLVARNAPIAAASRDQAASNSLAPDAAAADASTPSASAARDVATAPAAPAAVASPAPLPATTPSNDANDTNVPKPRSANRNGGQARNAQPTPLRVASAADVRKSSELPDDRQSSLETAARSDGGMGATAPSTPPPNDAPASSDVALASAASAQSRASGPATDGQITTQVRSAVATVAPGGNIDVTATSGIVALTGSVPSQDVVDQARQAAQQVAGVRLVDTSALIVANR
jgi:hypothetical protein